MEVFTNLIIESPARIIRITLSRPMTLDELWGHCKKHQNRPLPILTLTKGTVRVTYSTFDRRVNP